MALAGLRGFQRLHLGDEVEIFTGQPVAFLGQGGDVLTGLSQFSVYVRWLCLTSRPCPSNPEPAQLIISYVLHRHVPRKRLPISDHLLTRSDGPH